jgi:hypothetical protein
VMVGAVRQWWASGGLLAFRAVKLAQRMNLKEGMVDGRDPTERFIWLIGTGDDNAYGRHSPPWGCNHGCSPIRCGLQVKTWSGSLRRTTTGSVLRILSRDVIFKTLWLLLARFHLQAINLRLGCEGWHRLGGAVHLLVVFVGG